LNDSSLSLVKPLDLQLIQGTEIMIPAVRKNNQAAKEPDLVTDTTADNSGKEAALKLAAEKGVMHLNVVGAGTCSGRVLCAVNYFYLS
jgi:hypothetical protein